MAQRQSRRAHAPGLRSLNTVTHPRSAKGKSVKPIVLQPYRAEPLRALFRPDFNIAGIRGSDLMPLTAELSPSALSRYLARLRHIGIIRCISGSYRHYLTASAAPPSAIRVEFTWKLYHTCAIR